VIQRTLFLTHNNPLSSPSLQTASVKGVAEDMEANDGDVLPVSGKDLGRCELFPQTLQVRVKKCSTTPTSAVITRCSLCGFFFCSQHARLSLFK
jgi:hypothetical protein